MPQQFPQEWGEGNSPYKDWSIEKLYEQLEILHRRIDMYRGTLLPKDANIVEESVLEIMKIRSELNKRKSRR